MDFNPEAEYEVIRESVSHKLDISLVKPTKKVWRESTKNKDLTSPFWIGDSLIYINEGHNDMVELVYVNPNDLDIIKYIIKLLILNTMVVTKKFL